MSWEPPDISPVVPRHLVIAMAVLLAAVLGLSIYALQVRKTATSTRVVSIDARPLAPPLSGPSEQVTLNGRCPGHLSQAFLVDPGVAVIDVNAAFADTHRSGVLVEELTVASLIHTISANTPGIVKVKILVDGQQRDTLAGHADLSDFYDVSAVTQLAQELQSAQ